MSFCTVKLNLRTKIVLKRTLGGLVRAHPPEGHQPGGFYHCSLSSGGHSRVKMQFFRWHFLFAIVSMHGIKNKIFTHAYPTSQLNFPTELQIFALRLLKVTAFVYSTSLTKVFDGNVLCAIIWISYTFSDREMECFL